MVAFDFWRKWLMVVSVALVAFGVVLALFPRSPLLDYALNSRIDPVFWPDGNMPESAAQFRAWLYGVLGATISGWGIVMAFIVHYPFRAQQWWAWNAMAAGITTWFLIDTALSAAHHVMFNVLFNTVVFLLIAVPLIATRRHLSMQEAERSDVQRGRGKE
ncbi:hypothetical protein ACFL2Q_08390 [Thermodesulfobacteriota bacterium]